jgi:hypothetical protein
MPAEKRVGEFFDDSAMAWRGVTASRRHGERRSAVRQRTFPNYPASSMTLLRLREVRSVQPGPRLFPASQAIIGQSVQSRRDQESSSNNHVFPGACA